MITISVQGESVAEVMSEIHKLVIAVSSDASKATEPSTKPAKTATRAAEKVEEKVADKPASPDEDSAKEVSKLIGKLVQTVGMPKTIALLGVFKVKKGGELTAAQHADFLAAGKKALEGA